MQKQQQAPAPTERLLTTTALEIPVAAPREDRLEAVRQLMMNGFAPIVEACLDNLALPAEEEAFMVEAAHFTIYFLTVRLTDLRRQPPELRNTMQSWRMLHKAMEKVVTGRLQELAIAHRDGELQG